MSHLAEKSAYIPQVKNEVARQFKSRDGQNGDVHDTASMSIGATNIWHFSITGMADVVSNPKLSFLVIWPNNCLTLLIVHVILRVLFVTVVICLHPILTQDPPVQSVDRCPGTSENQHIPHHLFNLRTLLRKRLCHKESDMSMSNYNQVAEYCLVCARRPYWYDFFLHKYL